MQTRDLNHTDLVYMNAGIDPDWTLNLPVGFQGATIGFITDGAAPVNITINCQTGDQIRIPGYADTAQFAATIVREGYFLVFKEDVKIWQLAPNLGATVNTMADVAPTLIDAVDVQLPLSYRAGDVDLFTFAAGQVTAVYSLPGIVVNLEAALYVEMTLPGNNQFIEIATTWQLVSGTGSFLPIGSGGYAAHSRAISPTVDMAPRGLWTPVAGDVVQLVASEVDSDGAAYANVLDGIASITVPPL